jgi:radical SAM protein with 4Fe4S-binding SPASM domain
MKEKCGEYKYSEKDKFVNLLAKKDFHETLIENLGESFREYREKWDQSGRFELETPVPLHLDFEFVTACNLACVMCPFGLPKESRPKTFNSVSGRFPFDLFKRIIDEGVSLGTSAIDLSYFTEPLLRKDLMDFLDYASKSGILDIMFSTNGMLLTEDWTEKILDSKVTRFLVSIDAFSKETYEKIRKGGEYQTVVNNVNYFLKRKRERKQELPITRISFVKTKTNEKELDDFVNYWKPRVDYLSIQELMNFENTESGIVPDIACNNPNFKCHQPWHRLTIRANGDALPCCTIWGQELVVGNLNRQSLQEIWMSQEMKTLRMMHKNGLYFENSVCKKCAEHSVVK